MCSPSALTVRSLADRLASSSGLSDQGVLSHDSDRNRPSPPTVAAVDEHNLVAISRFGDRIRVTATAEFAGYDTSHKPSDFTFMKRVTQELYPTAPTTIALKCGPGSGR